MYLRSFIVKKFGPASKIVWLPKAWGFSRGELVQFEAKTPTGKLSELQKVRGAEIEKAGGIWIVVTSKEAVDRELKERGLV